ncbi:hypothetical protein CB0940_10259 [Cercospora beticola]|uniref:Uncharacterized protein n=1 Tax=Cercospora beticola TaxID=122368 RepID=A0A2G5HTV4_CERBT|nr:hypothetical protein CB0940_10259 [Cercospora beticola]PIA95958.1 hypothetical protein CB0940_10259 [Cercospora beticola]
MTTNNPGLTMNDFGPTWTKDQHKQRALLYRVDLRYTSGGSYTTTTRDLGMRSTAVLQRSISPIPGLHCFLFFFPSLQQHLRGRLPSSKRVPKSEKSLNLVTLWAQFQALQRGVGSGLKAQCFWGQLLDRLGGESRCYSRDAPIGRFTNLEERMHMRQRTKSFHGRA